MGGEVGGEMSNTGFGEEPPLCAFRKLGKSQINSLTLTRKATRERKTNKTQLVEGKKS